MQAKAGRWRRLLDLGWRERLDLLSAMAELAFARVGLIGLTASDLLDMRSEQENPSPSDEANGEIVARVAFAIPRVAARLPWRSDCLVQALAARRWLRRRGISTLLVMGVDGGGDAFKAHAWLMADSRIVTGGDVAQYTPVSPPFTSRR